MRRLFRDVERHGRGVGGAGEKRCGHAVEGRRSHTRGLAGCRRVKSRSLAFVVADDEPSMLEMATVALETRGFETEVFTTAEAVNRRLTQRHPDLVVLDVMLPGVSAITLCRRIKARWNIPIMLVTAKDHTVDRIAGLEADVDAYVAKPYRPRDLASRARRLVQQRVNVVRVRTAAGILHLDARDRSVSLSQRRVFVTDYEFRLLRTLALQPGRAVGPEQLLVAGWGEMERFGNRDMLKAAVARLRRKLDGVVVGSSAVIEVVHGGGYRLRDT